MKKLLTGLFCLVALFALASCGAKEYKLGMGVVVSTESSTNAKTAQIDATVATVVTENGKIVACRIDAVQNKISVSATGEVTVPTSFKTKMELGTEYGMSTSPYSSHNNNDGIIKEWNEQAKLFEEYVVGKTGAEVEALELEFVNNHYISKDADLLAAGCTIQLTDFIAAVVKACNDDQGTTFSTSKDFTLGVAATSFNDGSASAGETAGKVQVYTDFAAVAVVDGKIVAALNDAIQPKFTVSTTGELTASFAGTKRELKEGYGMSTSPYSSDNNNDGVIKEWFEQSALFSQYVVGMTGSEVAALATNFVNNHYISTDADLLASGCTIQITAIQAVVAKSVSNAR